jgi:hypothetical protein
MIIDNIKESISNETWIDSSSFDVIKNLSIVVNNVEFENDARELVIRILEHADKLPESEKEMLNSLVRQVGLFPYLNVDSLSTSDLLAYEFHRPLNMDEENIVFHSAQTKAYFELLSGKNVILSAPTSFGKSLIIDAMISTHKFKNIVIIVPTISLIDETRRRLLKFAHSYKIITHNEQQPSDRNIFVMTQERALNYEKLENIDFFVIDEFYKLSPDSSSDRAYSLNEIFYKLVKTGAQFYLLGPNVESVPTNTKGSLDYTFIKTDFSTVVTETKRITPSPSAEEATVNLCKKLDEPTLIYCKSPNSVRGLVSYLLDNGLDASTSELDSAIDWISENYHPDWLLVRALKKGIGIHHGKLPRSLSQYIVKAFNEGSIRYLVCTSTLIEGVNTSAKNVIIFDNKIALKNLDFFTFNNIKGRSGRMFKHFVGNVFILNSEPLCELPTVDIPVLTQKKGTSNKLLVQLDWDDLSDHSKDQVKHIHTQDILDIGIIKRNSGIDPDIQISLAKAINSQSLKAHNLMSWNSYPTYDELNFICGIAWQLLKSSERVDRSSIKSPSQLCYKVWQLINYSIKDMIYYDVENGVNPDDAVEKNLNFIRNWAGYIFPRYLKAADSIQRFSFNKLGMRPGSYSFFADSVENLFMPPCVTALEEYGIPQQITLKLADILSLDDGLDVVLNEIQELNVDELDLSPFEKYLISSFKSEI